MRKPNTASTKAAPTPKNPSPKLRTSTGGRARSTRTPKARDKTSSATVVKNPSKSDQILSLLRRTKGASLAELQQMTSWQTHSVRGFLSGTVKKRMGLNITSVKPDDGERRYMIDKA